MSSNAWLLYGANGYTGGLVAHTAVRQGLRPILAGRNPVRVAPLAAELGLDYRAFALEDTPAVEVAVVLNCAGPFSHTATPKVDGCLRTRTYYLDITGEIAVFEALAARDAEAKAAGIMLLPGAGFDVVPSDCLAAHLKGWLPAATRLTLGLRGLGKTSRLTATTVVENIHRAGAIRCNGVVTPVPAAWKTKQIDLGRGPVTAVLVPWGDMSTAYYSTGIPNIEVYMTLPALLRRLMVLSRYLGWLLGTPAVQSFLKRLVQAQASGPTEAERARGLSLLWGEASDDTGNRVRTRMQTPEGYTLTALTAVAIAQKVLAGFAPVGFQTPPRAYGVDSILEFEGVMRSDE
jgi:short subunit dehydrogenase-like uncharacterized protein